MEKFKPFVATHNSAFQPLPELFVCPAVAHAVLYSDWTRDCLNVKYLTEHVTNKDWTKNDADPKAQALKFKEIALRLGATPEAIRLLGTLIPLTTKETKTMAEKLKAKAAGNAAALKDAAKKAPVAKGAAEQPKKRGNAEALAKARAAKGPDNRKIKVLKKAHGARAGSSRATMLDTIYKAKTVEEAKTAGVTGSQVSWAAKEGYISLS